MEWAHIIIYNVKRKVLVVLTKSDEGKTTDGIFYYLCLNN